MCLGRGDPAFWLNVMYVRMKTITAVKNLAKLVGCGSRAVFHRPAVERLGFCSESTVEGAGGRLLASNLTVALAHLFVCVCCVYVYGRNPTPEWFCFRVSLDLLLVTAS